MEKEVQIYDESLRNLGEITATLLELTNINNYLDSQDEEDRQSISLWGMYEKNKSKGSKEYGRSIDHIRKADNNERHKLSSMLNQKGEYNVVTIDKNCLSCSNSGPTIISAFKMA